MIYRPATQPTLYFIGVTTAKSSIMQVFPAWARHLGLVDAVIKGIDFPLHADPAAYRAAVSFIKADPLSLGALVTTHKIDLYAAAQDLFEEVDPYARLMHETSCISKQGAKLACHAKDPISSGLTIDSFLPADHFARWGAELFSIGAGGSTIAHTWHLAQRDRGANRPSRIVVADRDQARLDEIRRIHQAFAIDLPVDYVRVADAAGNDAILGRLKPHALVINATGLGKDRPGSPLTDAARFPERAIAWDLNYRGDLIFLDQARRQQEERHLQIENGWTYFIHGWTQVIAEVFHIGIPTGGPGFDALSHIAAAAKG
ncbi:shikimate dehydrogenase [Dongia sp.]|uniref:shikimate dehydrogenase family protein n=1 Tax=Dongia sp. TaxID=1977262 RepID=UPI0035B120BA